MKSLLFRSTFGILSVSILPSMVLNWLVKCLFARKSNQITKPNQNQPKALGIKVSPGSINYSTSCFDRDSASHHFHLGGFVFLHIQILFSIFLLVWALIFLKPNTPLINYWNLKPCFLWTLSLAIAEKNYNLSNKCLLTFGNYAVHKSHWEAKEDKVVQMVYLYDKKYFQWRRAQNCSCVTKFKIKIKMISAITFGALFKYKFPTCMSYYLITWYPPVSWM